MSTSPFRGITVQQKSRSLAGRLAAMLLADQGAKVYAPDRSDGDAEGLDDFLDRGKTLIPAEELEGISGADIVIIDGGTAVSEPATQIVLGFTVSARGDDRFDLPNDASDDLLNALIGFYTHLGVTSRRLSRHGNYTPLPLCSVYAVVLSVSTGNDAVIWV